MKPFDGVGGGERGLIAVDVVDRAGGWVEG